MCTVMSRILHILYHVCHILQATKVFIRDDESIIPQTMLDMIDKTLRDILESHARL